MQTGFLSTPEYLAEIIRRTNADHPYETVHMLATEIVDADPDHRQRILDETAEHSTEKRADARQCQQPGSSSRHL